jgi:hypothetical protein
MQQNDYNLFQNEGLRKTTKTYPKSYVLGETRNMSPEYKEALLITTP